MGWLFDGLDIERILDYFSLSSICFGFLYDARTTNPLTRHMTISRIAFQYNIVSDGAAVCSSMTSFGYRGLLVVTIITAERPSEMATDVS